MEEKPAKANGGHSISKDINFNIVNHKKQTKKPQSRLREISFNSVQALTKAKKLLSEKKEPEAEDTLRTILLFEPNNINALSLLGGIFYYSGRYKEAEHIFKHQVTIDPNSYLAYNRLASTLAKQKKYGDAIKTNSQALSINPESPAVHINLAGMYSITGKKKQALMHFKKAYAAFGYAILPLSYDTAFDNIRYTPEFQSIIAKAKKDLPPNENQTKIKRTKQK